MFYMKKTLHLNLHNLNIPVEVTYGTRNRRTFYLCYGIISTTISENSSLSSLRERLEKIFPYEKLAKINLTPLYTDSYVYLNSYGELCRFDEVIDEGGAFETVNMNKDLVYIATVEQNESNSIFYAIVRDKSTQKYYSQQFEFGITGTSAYLRTISEKEFPDIIDENTCFSVGYKTTDVWYSKGSILYKYNRELNDTPVKYRDFETGDIKGWGGFSRI